MTGPATYLDVAVPDHIRSGWQTWAGVDWRITQHGNHNNLHPPDQRFTVLVPEGLCAVHRKMWFAWRNKTFRGNQFPGGLLSDGLTAYTREHLDSVWADARCNWDRDTIAQMRAVEQCCLSGRSSQCSPTRILLAEGAAS